MRDLPSTTRLGSLFSVPVACTLIDIDDYSTLLLPEEIALASSMGTSRLKGFSSGRLAARRSLTSIGIDNYPLLIGDERAPVWPNSVYGSISHCPDLCVAAVSSDSTVLGLGIDVECRQKLEDGVQQHVLTATERTTIDQLPPGQDWPCLVFSIKEALFKALHPLFGVWIDFQQAEITLDPERQSWQMSLAPVIVDAMEKARKEKAINATIQMNQGRYLSTGSHVYSSAEVVISG